MRKNAGIWQVKGAGPAVAVHHTRLAAEAEAKRLASLHPGQDFYVMQAVAIHRNISTERISLDSLDEDGALPF